MYKCNIDNHMQTFLFMDGFPDNLREARESENRTHITENEPRIVIIETTTFSRNSYIWFRAIERFAEHFMSNNIQSNPRFLDV